MAISACDLLRQECADQFQQVNESNARASIKSIIAGKGKVMSFKDIEEARNKREEREAAKAAIAERRGRKRKNSTSAPAPRQGKNSRLGEVEEANREINASGLSIYRSVF